MSDEIRISSEGTPEEHAHAKAIGAAWQAGFRTASERAPAYAGHQAHPCPVCLNVHGGEHVIVTVEELAAAMRKVGLDGDLPEFATAIYAALTERSAT